MLFTQDLEKLKEEIQGTKGLQDMAQLHTSKMSSKRELMAPGAEFVVSGGGDWTLGPKSVSVIQSFV